MAMLEKIMLRLVVGTAFVTLLILACTVWYAFYPHVMFTTIPEPWPVQHAEGLRAGVDAVVSTLDETCKYTTRSAEIRILLVGATDEGKAYVRILPTTSGSLPKGCRKQPTDYHIVDLPGSIPPGTYKLNVVFEYDLGVTLVESVHSTVPFKVTHR